MDDDILGGAELTPEQRARLRQMFDAGALREAKLGEPEDPGMPPVVRAIMRAATLAKLAVDDAVGTLLCLTTLITSAAADAGGLADIAQLANEQLTQLLRRAWREVCLLPDEQDDPARLRANTQFKRRFGIGLEQILTHGYAWPEGSFGQLLFGAMLKNYVLKSLEALNTHYRNMVLVVTDAEGLDDSMRNVPLIQLRASIDKVYQDNTARVCPRREEMGKLTVFFWKAKVAAGVNPEMAFTQAHAIALDAAVCKHCRTHEE